MSRSRRSLAVLSERSIHVPRASELFGHRRRHPAGIYSLGVILYELLTGLRPIDSKRLEHAALTEMIRIIRDDQPCKPSTRLSSDESLPSMAAVCQTDPRRLMALLAGELDWVVMKCLEKDRERRYELSNRLAVTSSRTLPISRSKRGRRRRDIA